MQNISGKTLICTLLTRQSVCRGKEKVPSWNKSMTSLVYSMIVALRTGVGHWFIYNIHASRAAETVWQVWRMPYIPLIWLCHTTCIAMPRSHTGICILIHTDSWYIYTY